MIEQIVNFRKLFQDNPFMVDIEINSRTGATKVHCLPDYLYGHTDLSVRLQGLSEDTYRVSWKVEGIEFFCLVDEKRLNEEFSHLVDEASA
jgi:hypothetical protein